MVPINATVPAVEPDQVPGVLARFPGAATAKVKVAEPGQTLADDVARVNAVRAVVATVRVDANGGWSVDEAVAAAAALFVVVGSTGVTDDATVTAILGGGDCGI